MMVLEAITAYTAYSQCASVRLNGQEIGRVPPIPYTPGTHYGGNLLPVSFVFQTRLMNGDRFNELTVVPMMGWENHLLLGHAWIHFPMDIPSL